MNPNDPTVLRILGGLEAGVGEHERAIEHLQQALRLSPRQARNHEVYHLLAFAAFGAKQYINGIDWATHAINDMPRMLQAHINLVVCLVGVGEVDKAKAAFAAGQTLAPDYFRSRLEGTALYARPDDRMRQLEFLRIAAGPTDPSAAEALR